MLLWIVNFMLFLFLFGFFKKTKPTGSRPHHMAKEVQRNAEERNNTGSLPSVQHTMWCLFSNKSKPWFCGLLQLAFHTADPPLRQNTSQRASVCPVTISSLSSNFTRTLTHWVLSLLPLAALDFRSLFFSSTFFLHVASANHTLPFSFLTGHSFSAFYAASSSFSTYWNVPGLSLGPHFPSELILFYGFFFSFALCICSILVPCPEIQPMFPEVGAHSPNRWTAREFPVLWQGYR